MASRWPGVRSPYKVLTIGLPLLLLAAGVAVARPGDLDPTFGRGGRVFINMDAHAEAATSLVQQGDGKLLVGRDTNAFGATTADLSVLRLNPDGTPDASFGGDGAASTDLPGITASTRAVVQQDAGKVVAAGPAWEDDDPNRLFAGLVRYQADGTLDATFGSGGVVLENYGASSASIHALVVLSDGRLIAAGGADRAGGSADMAFARFDTNGSIDATFGSNGRLVVDFDGAGRYDTAHALVQRPDGRLIAAGMAYEATNSWQPVLLGLTADGAVDSSFGTNGHAIPDFAGRQMVGESRIGLQSDGKIVVAGAVTGGTQFS